MKKMGFLVFCLVLYVCANPAFGMRESSHPTSGAGERVERLIDQRSDQPTWTPTPRLSSEGNFLVKPFRLGETIWEQRWDSEHDTGVVCATREMTESFMDCCVAAVNLWERVLNLPLGGVESIIHIRIGIGNSPTTAYRSGVCGELLHLRWSDRESLPTEICQREGRICFSDEEFIEDAFYNLGQTPDRSNPLVDNKLFPVALHELMHLLGMRVGVWCSTVRKNDYFGMGDLIGEFSGGCHLRRYLYDPFGANALSCKLILYNAYNETNIVHFRSSFTGDVGDLCRAVRKRERSESFPHYPNIFNLSAGGYAYFQGPTTMDVTQGVVFGEFGNRGAPIQVWSGGIDLSHTCIWNSMYSQLPYRNVFTDPVQYAIFRDMGYVGLDGRLHCGYCLFLDDQSVSVGPEELRQFNRVRRFHGLVGGELFERGKVERVMVERRVKFKLLNEEGSIGEFALVSKKEIVGGVLNYNMVISEEDAIKGTSPTSADGSTSIPPKVGEDIFERVRDTGEVVRRVTVPGINEQDYAVGVYIFGSRNEVRLLAPIQTRGDYSLGVRVGGVGNRVFLPSTSLIKTEGKESTGIWVLWGKDHFIGIDGIVRCMGNGSTAMRFDFGVNPGGVVGRCPGKRMGSYVHSCFVARSQGDEQVAYDEVHLPILPECDGPLVQDCVISGSIVGGEMSMYIADNAFVRRISFFGNSRVEKDIVSEWRPIMMRQVQGGERECLFTDMLFGVRRDSSTGRMVPDPQSQVTFEGNIEDKGHGLRVSVVGGVLNCTREECSLTGLNMFWLRSGAALQIPCELDSVIYLGSPDINGLKRIEGVIPSDPVRISATKIRLNPESEIRIDCRASWQVPPEATVLKLESLRGILVPEDLAGLRITPQYSSPGIQCPQPHIIFQHTEFQEGELTPTPTFPTGIRLLKTLSVVLRFFDPSVVEGV